MDQSSLSSYKNIDSSLQSKTGRKPEMQDIEEFNRHNFEKKHGSQIINV